MAVGFANLAGAGAGVAIIAVGLFILAARPASALHRFFFLLALFDGASTILLRLFLMADDPWWQRYFIGTYFYFFVAFVGLLAVFGLGFPKPLANRKASIFWTIVAVGTTLLALVGYTLDHSLFWTPTSLQGIAVTVEPLGNLVNIGFVLVIALLVARLTRAHIREVSTSHRRQASYVLGGMALAYLPYPWTVTVQDVAANGLAVFYEGRPDRVFAHWVFLFGCAVTLASMVLIAREADRTRADRLFVLWCYGGVAALAAVSIVSPTSGFGVALRAAGLLAYPLLLGYAIARYEVFDIDKKLRRAATVTFATAGLALSFLVAENLAENFLEDNLFSGIPSGMVSGTAAALLTALAFIPVARQSRKAAAKLVPELNSDEVRARKLEIYRHSVAGALADGILKEGESRTLNALRASLGITDDEHQRIVSDTLAA